MGSGGDGVTGAAALECIRSTRPAHGLGGGQSDVGLVRLWALCGPIRLALWLAGRGRGPVALLFVSRAADLYCGFDGQGVGRKRLVALALVQLGGRLYRCRYRLSIPPMARCGGLCQQGHKDLRTSTDGALAVPHDAQVARQFNLVDGQYRQTGVDHGCW